ncbi:purine-nucleoside phosphorylase [Acidicapsa ligni]|uniref:purine-nucleoside phosphorylase n=1 Tax=Acidicapsa ligni TaxID=542300 RepID=UPI0021E04E3A|nr:purine nucleoside permease [Acidicapsa ligni]
MRIFPCCLIALLTLVPYAGAKTKTASTPPPIPVKVVAVAMFEAGADTGDIPGELQNWVERDHLDTIYPLPSAYHDVRMNSDGELAIVTGQGTAYAAATIMALGLDPRFDLTHAYWIVAGIAGANPEYASLGSAVWANWIVDGDLGYEIDAREIPQNATAWSTGMVPLRKTKPFEEPAAALPGQFYQTNRSLMLWAYGLTKNVALADSAHLAEVRSHFDGAAANNPPQVLLGDEVSSSTYWHGKLMDAWATRWMSYFTGGQGKFVTTAMEDTGTLQSLRLLANAKRVDWQRVLILRTVSNYDQQPRGMDAATSLAAQRTSKFGAYLPSIESAYTVGHTVVTELLKNWPQYQEQIPKQEPQQQP